MIYYQAVSKPVGEAIPDTAHLRNQASQTAKQLADLRASVAYAHTNDFKNMFIFCIDYFFSNCFFSRQREALSGKIPNLVVLEAKMRTKASAATSGNIS